MPTTVFQTYQTLTATEQEEVFDFMSFLIAKRSKAESIRENPLKKFYGVMSSEDSKIIINAIDDCRRVDSNEW